MSIQCVILCNYYLGQTHRQTQDMRPEQRIVQHSSFVFHRSWVWIPPLISEASCSSSQSLQQVLRFFSRRNRPPPPVGHGLLRIEASRSHSDTPHSVRLLWTRDRPDVGTSTWRHTTLRHPCPPAGIELTVPASQRQQIHALDGTATGTGRSAKKAPFTSTTF